MPTTDREKYVWALTASAFSLGGNVALFMVPLGLSWLSLLGIVLSGLSTLYFGYWLMED